jgi:predicted nucleic acid-binding protein
VIYVDTSVILAHVLAEDRSPADDLWAETLVSSRLTIYETWIRLNGRRLAASHGNLAREAVRALDALHLATLSFLAGQRQRPKLATYDLRMADAATRLGFELHRL